MRRLMTVFLAVCLIMSLWVFQVHAQETSEYYNPDDEKLTHLELLEKLCTGFPYVGYEKYPQVPLFFQQNYPDVPYGGPGHTMETHGCGITCLAMIATYLTDREHSPEVLASQFRSYGSSAGTDFMLFVDAPRILGLPFEERVFSGKDVVEALEQGKTLVSIQIGGIFTSTGHFIVLSGITPEGKILVNDPNLKNYQGEERFYDGFLNGFEQKDVFRNSRVYWVFGKKLVRFPGCSRCADPEMETAPVFEEPYYCPKCAKLLHVQRSYREALAAVQHHPET